MSESLNYEIRGDPMFASLEVDLQPGQQLKAEAGSMAYMDGSIQMNTSASGGIWKGIKRSLSAQSFWQNTYTGPGKITLASPLPGDIVALTTTPEEGGWILTRDAYLGGTLNMEVSGKWGGFRSIFGGEGAFLTHVKSTGGQGLFFAGGYGHIKKHEIPEGKEFVIDTGLFFATSEHTQFKISKIGGWKSFFLGGEGLVMRFFGPCVVLTQSRSMYTLVKEVKKKMPKSTD